MDSEALSEDEAESIRSTVLELSERVVRNAERVDVDAAYANHSSDADATHANMGHLHNRESLVRMYRDLYEAAESQEIDFGTPVVTVLGRSAAVVASDGEFRVRTKDGGRIRSRAAWTWVWVRRDGSWQLLHSHQSFPAPPSPE